MNTLKLFNPDIELSLSYKDLMKQLKEKHYSYQKINILLISLVVQLDENGPEMTLYVFHSKKNVRAIRFVEKEEVKSKEYFDLIQEGLLDRLGTPNKKIDSDDSLNGVDQGYVWEDEEYSIEHHYFLTDHLNHELLIKSMKDIKERQKISKKLPYILSFVGGLSFGLLMFLVMGLGYGYTWINFLINMSGGFLFGIIFNIFFFRVAGGASERRNKKINKRLIDFESNFEDSYEIKLEGFIQANPSKVIQLQSANIYLFRSSLMVLTWSKGNYRYVEHNIMDIEKVSKTFDGILFQFPEEEIIGVVIKKMDEIDEFLEKLESQKTLLLAFK